MQLNVQTNGTAGRQIKNVCFGLWLHQAVYLIVCSYTNKTHNRYDTILRAKGIKDISLLSTLAIFFCSVEFHVLLIHFQRQDLFMYTLFHYYYKFSIKNLSSFIMIAFKIHHKCNIMLPSSISYLLYTQHIHTFAYTQTKHV